MNTPRLRSRARLAAPLLAVAAVATACGGASKAAVTTTTLAAPSSGGSTSTTSAPSATTTPSGGATTTTTPTASTTATSVPTCASDGLSVSAGSPSDQGAGSYSIDLVFTNTASSACTIDGFPGVSATNAAGAQIGQPASRTSQAASVVTLQPRQTATAVLRVAQADNYPASACGTVEPSSSLRIYPPGQTAALEASANIQMCSGSAVILQINPVTS